ncbi:MAG: UDP-glucose/GDP-mannose dehydrogenase family protein [Candidatus Thorarchaeota archaeon]|nr:UDP-glucose/GDP-mannose dehydrogenase family protein [Candidatus Thorarchaeota archaeon]
MKVAVFGAGYVGLSTAVVLAKKHSVTLIEIDETKIDLINNGTSPIAEKGLEPLLRDALERNSIKAVGLDEPLGSQDAVLICVNTPSGDDGSVNLEAVESVMSSIESRIDSLLDEYLLVAMRSTVPPGTTRFTVIERLSKNADTKKLGFIFQPEFLRQGFAIHDLLNPDRVIIGASDDDAYSKYEELTIQCLDKQDTKVLKMSIESAEMCKYASNSFLATKISFISELSSLAERIPHVNIDDVVLGMIQDHRISPSHLKPGLGYGGSCLPKDVSGLFTFGASKGVEMPLLKAVHFVNKQTTDRLLRLVDSLSLRGKKVAILGVAFKADTDDTRDSPSLPLIRRLSAEGAKVHAHDPLVNLEQTKNQLGLDFEIVYDISECTRDAFVTFIMTDWSVYKELGLNSIASNMSQKLVVDGRRMFVDIDVPDGIVYLPLGSYPEQRVIS